MAARDDVRRDLPRGCQFCHGAWRQSGLTAEGRVSRNTHLAPRSRRSTGSSLWRRRTVLVHAASRHNHLRRDRQGSSLQASIPTTRQSELLRARCFRTSSKFVASLFTRDMQEFARAARNASHPRPIRWQAALGSAQWQLLDKPAASFSPAHSKKPSAGTAQRRFCKASRYAGAGWPGGLRIAPRLLPGGHSIALGHEWP